MLVIRNYRVTLQNIVSGWTRTVRVEADSTEQAKLIAYEKSEWDEMIVEATDDTL